MKDSVIEIKRLRIVTRIDVPDEERADWQVLHVTVRLTTVAPFSQMQDQIASTVDYAELATSIKTLASGKARQLIETLAYEIAELVISHPLAGTAWVRVEKQILPDTDCVAVECSKQRGASE